jgi:hypothetical protein
VLSCLQPAVVRALASQHTTGSDFSKRMRGFAALIQERDAASKRARPSHVNTACNLERINVLGLSRALDRILPGGRIACSADASVRRVPTSCRCRDGRVWMIAASRGTAISER